MTARHAVVRRLAAGVLTLAVVAGCAKTVDGTANPVLGASVPGTTVSATIESSTTSTSVSSSTSTSVSSSSRSSPSSAVSGTSAPTGGDLDPAVFSARLQTSSAGISSMIGELAFDASGTTAQGAFSESVSNGKITAVDMNLHVKVGATTVTMRLLLVGGKVYVGSTEILAALGASDKKWALASVDSSNSTLRTLANSLSTYLSSSGTDQYFIYSKAATSIEAQGDERINNAPAHKYRLVVDLTKAATVATGTTQDSIKQLLASGTTTLPVTVWVDDQWRVVRAEDVVSAGGVTAKTQFGVSSYNSKVSITEPDPATVFTG